MKKKLLSFVLAALMIASCFGTFAVGSSAADVDTIKFDITSTRRDDGKYAVTFKIVENPGFAGFALRFAFDNTKATIVDYDKTAKGKLKSDLGLTSNLTAPGTDLSKLSTVTASYSQADDFTETATLFTVIFDVKESFSITLDKADISKSDDSETATGTLDNASSGKVELPAIDGLSFTGAEFTYDGKAHSVSVNNLPAGASVVYSGSGNTFTNVGEYTVNAAVTLAGYSPWTGTATLKITPKELTVSGLTATEKTYDATTSVELSGGSLVGVVSGDDVTATMPTTGTASVNKGTQTVAFTPITLSGAKSGNYTLKQPTVTVKINPYVVNVSANNASKKLGTTDPALTYTYNDTFVDANGGLTGSLTRDSGDTVGTYKIKRGTLAAANANIEINFTEGTFTINEKDPQIIVVTPSSLEFTYGDAEKKIDVAKSTGSANDITFTSNNPSVATVDATGKVTAVGAGTAVITVKSLGNSTYSDFEQNVNVTVNAKKVTVTPDKTKFTYGETNITYVLSETIDVTGALAFSSKNVGTANIVMGTLKPVSSNYTLELSADNTLVNIDAKKIDVKVNVICYPHKAGEAKVINKTETAKTVVISSADIVAGDTVNVDLTGITIDSDSNVSGLVLDNSNYSAIWDVTVTGNEVTEEKFVEIVEDAVKDIASDPSDLDVSAGVSNAVDELVKEIVDAVKEVIGDGIEVKFKETDQVNSDGSLKDGVTSGVIVVLTPVLYRNGTTVAANLGSYNLTVPSTGSSNIQSLLYFYYLMNQKKKTPVSAVTASVASGKVASGTKVVLSTETAGATIYYTTNGSVPTSLSKEYTGPITLTEGVTTISAIAVKSGMTTSTPVSFTYTVSNVVGTTISLKDGASDIKFMEGRGEKFEAEADATRYEVVKALAEIFNIVTDETASELSDVAAEYKDLVEVFTAAGVINGYSDGTFRGDKTITRAEFCKIVCIMLGLDVENVEDAGFKDTDHWAKAYIDACAAKGLVTGKSADRFDPNGNIKRGELATLICRITGAKAGTTCKYADVSSDAWYFGYVSAAAK